MKNLTLIEEIKHLIAQKSNLVLFNALTGKVFKRLEYAGINGNFFYQAGLKFDENGHFLYEFDREEYVGRRQLYFAELTENNEYNILFDRLPMQAYEEGDIVAYKSTNGECVGFVREIEGNLFISVSSEGRSTRALLSSFQNVRYIGR